jgi:hypothetical protein
MMNWKDHCGIPSDVVKDNYTQFANELLDELLNHLQQKWTKIQIYSHEEIGIVERPNKETYRHFCDIVHSRKKEYNIIILPLVQTIVNTSVHFV